MNQVPTSARAQPVRRHTLSPAVAFWVIAAVFFFLLFTSAAPSPLYRVYQAEWHFATVMLTAIFGIYAVVLLATLLFLGSLSDFWGRRRIILFGLTLTMSACVLFLIANGIGWLLLSRVIQGLAVGVTASALGAALIELQPEGSSLGTLLNSSAPTAGLAVGGLLTSALVQYGPDPTHLVWWLLLTASIVAGAAVFAMPETASRSDIRFSFRPHVDVPRQARQTFITVAPALVAVWALGGFYLSLGPSLTAELTASQNRLWGGVVIFLLYGTASIVPIVFRTAGPKRTMMAGCLVLLAGLGVVIAAIVTTAATLFLVGTATAGVGLGLAFAGAFRTLSALAPPKERAGLIAAIYIISYVAFCVPALAAGLAVSYFGLQNTALAYCGVVGVLLVLAVARLGFRTDTAIGQISAAASADLPPGPCTVHPCR